MAFHEKTAWIMSIALLLGGTLYYGFVVFTWLEFGQLIPSALPLVVLYTIFLVAFATVGHIVVAILAPKDANARTDEREKRIISRAGHASSVVMAVGILLSLGAYLIVPSGDLLFYTVFATLMLAQISEYLLQIVYFRFSF